MTITATARAASGTSELTANERSALKKAAWRLLPLLTIAYLFNYFDRTVVGFAALTMNRDIGLTSSQFGFGAGIAHSFAGLFLDFAGDLLHTTRDTILIHRQSLCMI